MSNKYRALELTSVPSRENYADAVPTRRQSITSRNVAKVLERIYAMNVRVAPEPKERRLRIGRNGHAEIAYTVESFVYGECQPVARCTGKSKTHFCPSFQQVELLFASCKLEINLRTHFHDWHRNRIPSLWYRFRAKSNACSAPNSS